MRPKVLSLCPTFEPTTVLRESSRKAKQSRWHSDQGSPGDVSTQLLKDQSGPNDADSSFALESKRGLTNCLSSVRACNAGHRSAPASDFTM